MADVIVYPWHGFPHKYVDTAGVYAPQVATVFDADGPIILNRFGLAERLSDNGDGTYAPVVTTTTDPTDLLVVENGVQQRYSDQGDDTYCRVIASSSLGGDDVSVYNTWGLQERYIDLGDGTFAQLINGSFADSVVYDSFGVARGFDQVLGYFSPLLSGVASVGTEVNELWGSDTLVWLTDSGAEPSVWRI